MRAVLRDGLRQAQPPGTRSGSSRRLAVAAVRESQSASGCHSIACARPPTTMPTWPSARSSRSPARGAVAAGTIRSVVETMSSNGQASAAGSAISPPTRHRPRAAQIGGEQALEHLARRALPETGGPSLAQSSSMTKVRASLAFEAGKGLELGDGAGRIEAPEGALQHLHRQHAERRDGGPRVRPEPGEIARALVGEAAEMPGRGDRRDAAGAAAAGRRRAPSCRRGNSRPGRPARRARAISGSRIASTWPATDSAAPVRAGPAPVEQQHPPAAGRASQRSSERSPMSSTFGGLISDGTNRTGGPSPP